MGRFWSLDEVPLGALVNGLAELIGELERRGLRIPLWLAAPALLEACKAQHQAIDMLFAMLIQRDATFYPSKSGLPWEAVQKGNEAIHLAEKGKEA